VCSLILEIYWNNNIQKNENCSKNITLKRTQDYWTGQGYFAYTTSCKTYDTKMASHPASTERKKRTNLL